MSERIILILFTALILKLTTDLKESWEVQRDQECQIIELQEELKKCR